MTLKSLGPTIVMYGPTPTPENERSRPSGHGCMRQMWVWNQTAIAPWYSGQA